MENDKLTSKEKKLHYQTIDANLNTTFKKLHQAGYDNNTSPFWNQIKYNTYEGAHHIIDQIKIKHVIGTAALVPVGVAGYMSLDYVILTLFGYEFKIRTTVYIAMGLVVVAAIMHTLIRYGYWPRGVRDSTPSSQDPGPSYRNSRQESNPSFRDSTQSNPHSPQPSQEEEDNVISALRDKLKECPKLNAMCIGLKTLLHILETNPGEDPCRVVPRLQFSEIENLFENPQTPQPFQRFGTVPLGGFHRNTME